MKTQVFLWSRRVFFDAMDISNVIGILGISGLLIWIFKSMASSPGGGGCGH
ncbi:hypothetical protein KDL44_13755 [bacterium]|nr:hypothetical protein [bacterium]